MKDIILRTGDVSDNGQVTIVDEDRLCYLVRSECRGAKGIRTISKALLKEFIEYVNKYPNTTPRDARNALSGNSDIDKYEYGYDSTLVSMAKMSLNAIKKSEEATFFAHSDNENQFALLVFNCLYKIDKFKRIKHLLLGQNKSKTLKDDSLGIKISGLFIECSNKEFRKANKNNYGHYHFFTEGFSIDNEDEWYLTSGWSKPEQGKLEPAGHTIYNLKLLVEHYYSNLTVIIKNEDCNEYVLKCINLDVSRKPIYLYNQFVPYVTAIKTKPFLLLAGISGTGKSRIVRELARACWDADSEEYKAQKPKNFEMVQVKPNWHDSGELIGYVSRVSGKAEFVAGDFLKFVAKAWEDLDTPYFLCLDEMKLAPVEQYFAEYLSVVESRRRNEDGTITTDPILKKANEEWYFNLTASLTSDEEIRKLFNEEGICLPQNLIVVGTVNMDETTFSFSRKVLDRAMTIEMNEVDLYGGLTDRHEVIGRIGNNELIGTAVEGVDIYSENKDVCDTAIAYLAKLNNVLEGTPFKVAYRTRNEFLLYVVNNLPYSKDKEGNDLPQGYVIARALDEITSMKILSRIEGDDTKVKESLLDNLTNAIKDGLSEISGEENPVESVSIAKLTEMKDRLNSGYTSFWS